MLEIQRSSKVGFNLLIKLARFIAVSFVFISATVGAVDERDLYQVTLKVDDQSQHQRQLAAQQAIEVVLLRIAGVDSAINAAPIKRAVTKASSYVQGFSYAPADESGFNLRLVFDATSVNKLLTDNSLPQWAFPRPEPLIWWVADTGAGKQMVALTDLVEDSQLLDEASNNRGFNFSSPLLDLEDRLALGANALWYNDINAIREASARYQSRYTVVARLAQVSSGWRVTFNMVSPEGQTTKDIRAADIETVFTEVANFTANSIAQATAIKSVVSSSSQSVKRVVVSGVLGFSDYAAVVDYLAQLTGVKSASVIQVEADRVYFDVQLSGEYERVKALIEAQGRLKSQPSDDPFNEQLNYYWLPSRD